MPISRYEVRNEYGLADPDLYRAADKDDPEALLEGVSMAGLVGVLRQLGDLAEFAADIFHNLHEEVVATTARGHGLMIRVQQLETEIPKIEMTFLSQTDHSAFFNHTGVGWHPNLRIDQNLVTQGDLPRLVMDSYEECRPPPRLFLLDKYDVAGAGACLKRYSDPSFFKVDNSGMSNADVVPREKKNRKVKKKGSRWKNGETNEVLPTSHTKLHQLFMEEARIETGVSNPILRAKLKRRLSGFPFNKKNGKSYMEKFLEYTSSDNKEVHGTTMNPSPLVSATYDYNESGIEVVEVRPVSIHPHGENVGRKRNPPSFSDREKTMVNSTIDEVPNLYGSITSNLGISSTQNEKIIVMDSYTEGSLIGYQSDDTVTVSGVENYMDASSTVVSNTDADSRGIIPSHVKSDSLISDANDENLQTRSFDSQSTGDSTISDEGNNSSGKGMSSFSSDSPTTSVGNPQFKVVSTRVLSPAIVDDFPVEDNHSESVVSADPCPNTDAITNHKSDCEQVTSDSTVAGKCMSEGTNADKSETTLDDENKGSNLVMDQPCSPCVSDAELDSGDDTKSNGQEVTELSKEDKSNTADMISAVPALSDNASTGHYVTEKSDLGNYVSDLPSLPIADYEVEESVVPEETGLNSINNQQLPDSLGSVLPPSNPLSRTNMADLPPLPPLPPTQWMMMGKLQLGSSSQFPQLVSQSTDDDNLTASYNNDTDNLGLVSIEGDVIMHTDAVPQLVSHLIVSIDEMKNSPILFSGEPTLREEEAESSRVEVYSMKNTVDLPPKNVNSQHSVMLSEEDRVVKLQRPRHPLIDEVTALDKSKLRKVTERFRPPQLQKIDERNALLEQIRNKSFNLKPALLPRPNIRGPSTNLRVAAIVEKANAIRQALAGSDEDDDDSWSDS